MDRIDALEHQRFAKAVLSYIDASEHGAVFALQGSWGHGKTDILKRVYALAKQRAADNGAPTPLWLDPWRYRTPDLIRPIVAKLITQIPDDEWHRRRAKPIAQALVKGGSAMVFKAVALFAPGPVGAIVGEGEKAANDAIDAWFSGESDKPAVELDPVDTMAELFRTLVNEHLKGASKEDRKRQLLICVDDLDRCLPTHQIAMLEAIHFLTSAGASEETNVNCSFVVALDPTLAQEAAATHYGTPSFDSNRYLDKLFTIRLRLPELSEAAVQTLVESELKPHAQLIRDGLGVSRSDVEQELADIAQLPELKNPRMIHRVCGRILLLASANKHSRDPRLYGPDRLPAVLTWCVIADRWPEMRQLLQDTPAAGWKANLKVVCYQYGIVGDDSKDKVDKELAQHANVPSRLPGRDRQPDLGAFLEHYVIQDKIITALAEADAAMVTLGL